MVRKGNANIILPALYRCPLKFSAMLFFVKIDKQLRLPVFALALIILAVIGIPPCRAQKSCYVCVEPDCEGKTDECVSDKEACKTTYSSGGGIERGCSTIPSAAKCAVEFYENGCYVEDDTEALNECIKGKKMKRADGEEQIKVTGHDKICMCLGRNCNGEGVGKGATTPQPTTTAKTGGGSTASGNFQLVFSLPVLATLLVINKEYA